MDDSPVLRSRKSQESPMKWKSPINYHESPKSSLLFSAQAKSYEKKLKSIRKIKNPFEPEDPMILEEHVCSPGLLEIGPEPEDFSWSIEDISRIKPASFESPHSVILEEDFDEGRESMAQQAIEKYFTTTHNIVSPDDAYTGTWRSPAVSTPTAPCSAKTISSTPQAKSRLTRGEVGVQTMYTFPPILPPHVEEILKAYICDIDVESNVSIDSEDNLLNTSTLRRKLFFNKEEEDLSPVKFSGRHLTPSPHKTDLSSRINWSAEKVRKCDEGSNSAPSSPDLSPIKDRSAMSLGSPDISSINGEVSMMAVDSSVKIQDGTEDMMISVEDHNRIFSSTVMPTKDHSGHTGGAESGYATVSYGLYPSRTPDY